MPRGQFHGHKYIKRTGTPGNYSYLYKDSSGALSAGDEHDQKNGKKDHALRMGIAKEQGLHNMSWAEIGEHTGVGHNHASIQSRLSRKRSSGRAHSYTEHHIKEAVHHDVDTPEYHGKIDREAAVAGGASHTARGPYSPPRTAPVLEPVTPADGPAPWSTTGGTYASAEEREAATAAAAPSTEPPSTDAGGPSESEVEAEESLSEARREEGIASNEAQSRRDEAAPASAAPPPMAPAEQKRLLKILKDKYKVKLPENDAEPAAAGESTAASVQESASRLAQPEPPSPEVQEADPALSDSENAINEIIELQRSGVNPYLKRSKEIFERIKNDMKPARRDNVSNFFQALAQAGDGATEAQIFAKFKALPGNNRRRGLPKDDIERGIFHTIDEVSNNPPINRDVEKMKRGYAAKQYLRLKPFLKDTWHQSNPARDDGGPPPPMPTWGDLKTWGRTELVPSWAVNQSKLHTAVPKEVFDAAQKESNGKPKYPPRWMPIHLMPVWNYIAKEGRDSNPYQSTVPEISAAGDVTASGQASQNEGHLMNSLRRYVTMRGEKNLVDIPAMKLQEAGLSHQDIFKAEPVSSDSGFKKMICNKFIDPVDFINWLKKNPNATKKSFSLFVDPDEVYKAGETMQLSLDLIKGGPGSGRRPNRMSSGDIEGELRADIGKKDNDDRLNALVKERQKRKGVKTIQKLDDLAKSQRINKIKRVLHGRNHQMS